MEPDIRYSSTQPRESTGISPLEEDFKSELFLFIELDYSKYVAGERVTGEILLNVPSSIEGCLLRLCAFGFEEIQLFDKNMQLLIQDSREIFSISSTIRSWNEITPPGQHIFPFSFKLPPYAPATFAYSGYDSDRKFLKAEIEYFIEAKLDTMNGGVSKANDRKELLIYNRMHRSNPEYSIETQEMLTTCCLFKKGISRVMLRVCNTEHPYVSGTTKFYLRVDNRHAKTRLDTLEIIVIMELLLGTGLNGQFDFSTRLEIARYFRPFNVAVGLEQGLESSITLNFPEDQNPSCNSSVLIQCSYKLEVLLHYNVRCKKAPIQINLPLHINPKPKQPRDAAVMPENWSPQEYSIHNLHVISNFRGYETDSLFTTVTDEMRN
jgi:hypothetical protein